jgi:hypothetical protein
MEATGDKGKGKEKDSGSFKCPSERGGGAGGKEATTQEFRAVRRRRLETTSRTFLRVKQESSVLWPREVCAHVCMCVHLSSGDRKKESARVY